MRLKCDLFVAQGEFKCFSELKVDNNLDNKDFYCYLQIRDYFKREYKTKGILDLNELVKVIIDSNTKNLFKLISSFYQALRENGKDSTNYILGRNGKQN